MGRRTNRHRISRANALKARKACQLKRSRINQNEIKTETEPANDDDLGNILKVDVKEEPEKENEKDSYHDNYVNEEEYDLGAEPFGMEFGGGQNSASENSAGGVIRVAPVDPLTSATDTVGQSTHCLLCNQECDPFDLVIENKENVSRTMFLMKKMLQVPNQMLEDYLVCFGSPSVWISLCVKCKVHVDNAFVVHKRISQLERTLRNYQTEMVDIVKKSVTRLPKYSVPFTEHVHRIAVETRMFVSTGESIRYDSNTKFGLANKDRFTATTNSTTDGGCDKEKEETIAKLKEVQKGHTPGRKRKSCPLAISAVDPEISFSVNVYDEDSNNFSLPDSVFSTHTHEKSPIQVWKFSQPDTVKGLSPQVPLSRSQAILNDPVICNVKSYTCDLCPHLDKMHFHHFTAHILFHHRRPYRCSACNTYYACYKELDHSPLNQKRLKEDAAGHVCTKDTIVKIKFTPQKIWSCENCSALFDMESERDEHENNFHPGKNKISSTLKHGCITCGRKFRNLKNWSLHRALEHPEVALLSCCFCNENFGYKTKEGVDVIMGYTVTVNNHLKEHHIKRPADFQVFTCDFCAHNFMRVSDLGKHMKEDHDLNPNRACSCCICFSRFYAYSALRLHLQDCHKAGTQERYVCDSCGYSASRREYFEVHNLEKHGIRPQHGRVRTCEIEDCTFEYLYKGYLDRHMMKVHNAARKYTCQYCGKGFITASHRSQHERIHVNKVEKPFKCIICGNSFAIRNYLYIHMRLSHLNRPFASTNKKRPSRKQLSTRPSNVNVGVNLTGSLVVPVPGPTQNIIRDCDHLQAQSGEISNAANCV